MVTKKNEITDLLPIACHYDDNTLLGKNGELIQIIKIDGFQSKYSGTTDTAIRERIRSTLTGLLNEKIMFYIYVVRDYMNVDIYNHHENEFAAMIHDAWVKDNKWDHSLVNRLYIAVVHNAARNDFNFSNIRSCYFRSI